MRWQVIEAQIIEVHIRTRAGTKAHTRSGSVGQRAGLGNAPGAGCLLGQVVLSGSQLGLQVGRPLAAELFKELVTLFAFILGTHQTLRAG